ncbi:MAG: ORF6N domain-containing protein [Dehalococcoidia bacterium]
MTAPDSVAEPPALPEPADAVARLDALILQVRGLSVMLDSDLAVLYGVRTALVLRAMRRNPGRFPPDFAFELTAEEAEALRIQSGSSSDGHGGRRYLPFVFTEEGVAMLSSVLRSERAVAVNVEIMRAFVRMRRMLAGHADLAARLDDLETRYNGQFRVIFEAIRELMAPPVAPGRRIGFATPEEAPA